MTDFRFRRLERYKTGGTRDRMELSFPAPQSPSGKIYRWCPNSTCSPRLFLLGQASPDENTAQDFHNIIRRSPGSPGITCPYCGLDAPDNEFTYSGDIQAVQDYLQWAATEDIGDMVDDLALQFNRRNRQRSGLISLNMKVERSRRPHPDFWREDLLRNLACDVCGREYGVYAIALFCPDCGTPNLHLHFHRELQLISEQIDLAQKLGSDKQELAYRLLGNAHEDVLTAFETYLKVIFRFLATNRLSKAEANQLSSKRVIGNRFQNIERGRQLFAKLNVDPYMELEEDDLSFLKQNIEKRHVVGHNLSLVDTAYVETARTSEQPGQTVQILADEVSRFGKICGNVVMHLAECHEFFPMGEDLP